MICLAFRRLNNPIPTNGRNFREKPKVIGKHRLEFDKIVKLRSYLSSKSASGSPGRRDAAKKSSESAAGMLTSGANVRIGALLTLRALSSFWRFIVDLFVIIFFPFRTKNRCVAFGTPAEPPEKGGEKDEKARGKVARVVLPRKSTAVDKDAATRRALAIRRVLEDDGNGEKEETVRDYSLLVTSRGDTVFTQSWTPVNVRVRGLIILLHGLNEHSGRYSDFAKKLNVNGFKVYGLDWIGHGGSDGLHAYVPSLDYAVNDFKMLLSKVKRENPRLACFCFGHSTGGSIILKAILDPKVQQQIAGVVVTSPAIGVKPTHPVLLVIAPVLSLLFPRFQFGATNKKAKPVSRDPEALLTKYSDPLVFIGAIRARTGYEILRITAFLQQNMSRLTVPFLVLHGTGDSVTDPNASQKLYHEASSSDKTIKLYQGLLHDLLFEPEKEEITETIIAWFVRRL